MIVEWVGLIEPHYHADRPGKRGQKVQQERVPHRHKASTNPLTLPMAR